MEQHIMDPKDLPIVLEVEKGITGIWYSRQKRNSIHGSKGFVH
jgi:hypothetical protein